MAWKIPVWQVVTTTLTNIPKAYQVLSSKKQLGPLAYALIQCIKPGFNIAELVEK